MEVDEIDVVPYNTPKRSDKNIKHLHHREIDFNSIIRYSDADADNNSSINHSSTHVEIMNPQIIDKPVSHLMRELHSPPLHNIRIKEKIKQNPKVTPTVTSGILPGYKSARLAGTPNNRKDVVNTSPNKIALTKLLALEFSNKLRTKSPNKSFDANTKEKMKQHMLTYRKLDPPLQTARSTAGNNIYHKQSHHVSFDAKIFGGRFGRSFEKIRRLRNKSMNTGSPLVPPRNADLIRDKNEEEDYVGNRLRKKLKLPSNRQCLI